MNVEIQLVNNQKGKGLFAKQNFKVGDVIFEEDPLVCCQFAWNQQYGYEACDHCMRPLQTAEENARQLTGNYALVLPYPECCETNKSSIAECIDCGVRYCSEQCRMTALLQYHMKICYHTRDRECRHPLEKLVETWKEIHFPPETFNIMLIVRIMAMVLQAKNSSEMLQHFMQFSHRTVNENSELAHKLLSVQFSVHQQELRRYISEALPSNGIEHWFTEEGFQSLLALIGTNGQGVGSSAISVWVRNSSNLPLPEANKAELDTFIDKLYKDMEESSGTFWDNEGSALYSLQSACNHSCDPNAQPKYVHNNFRLSMVALKDITAGEEIQISYLDECTLERSRHSRQKFLAENYLFKCDCNKCLSQADNPDATSEEEMSDGDD